jgi:hypothetical protein
LTSVPRTFRPENELEDALVTALQEEQADLFLAALAEAELYLPAPGPAPDAEQLVTAQEGDEIPLPLLEHGGERFIPVFSSPKQLLRYVPDGTPYLRLQGRALAAIWPADCRLALNPRGDLGLILSPEQVASVKDTPAPSGSGFLIGEPNEEPSELLEAIRAFASARPQIRAAYRGLLVRRTGARPELVIGLELEAQADAPVLIDAAADAARAAGIERLALVPLQPGAESGPIGRFLLEQTEPFYARAT